MNESPPLPSGLLKAYAAIAKAALWLLLALALVLALAWGALHGWIVPRIGEFRPDLEIEAARVLGVPVRIGAVTARSEGLVPSFELSDVVLLDAQGREALRLPQVQGALSPRSLWNLGFVQLSIDQPLLDVRRAADGKIFVAGLDLSGTSDNQGRAAEWFFRQTEFVIRNGSLRWTDEMRGAPPLALHQVDFVMRNTARSHALRLDATPPAEWGARFSLRGLFRQPLLSSRHGRWQDWVGELHADFPRVDVSQLRRHASMGVDVQSGHGAVRAWADVVKGQVTGGAVDLGLYEVNARLRPHLAPLALDAVSGRIAGKRLGQGFEVESRGLQFQTREGQRWPGGNLWVKWSPPQGSRPAQGQLRADRLDLAALSQVASRLPLGTVAHRALSTYSPKGRVETLQASWQGPLDALQKYQAQGRAAQLEVAASRAPPGAPDKGTMTPGVRGAAFDFNLTEAGGTGKLALQQGALEWPGVFEEPLIPFDRLAADLQWQIRGEDWSVSVSALKFSNADAQGEGQASWRTGATPSHRYPGLLDVQASMSRADAGRIWRYLPLTLPRETRDYVRQSLLKGKATQARFRVKGDLRDVPFGDGRSGEFRISTHLEDATYAFAPPGIDKARGDWPVLTQLSGDLVFEHNGMQIKDAVGRFAGAPGLQVKAQARIADMRRSTVEVTGSVRGPLSEALAVVNRSPLAGMTGQALARASASGSAEVQLQLALPLADPDRARVQGSVALAGNDVQLAPGSPLLAGARGKVVFSERGFTLAGVQARALGGDLRLEGGTAAAPQAPVVLKIQGTASAEGLRQARDLGFLAQLAKNATGSAAYGATLAFRGDFPELTVTSNLQGMALNLPAPFAKAADAVLPLRYENTLLRDPRHDRLAMELGRVAAMVFERDVSGAHPRVLRGGIALGLAPGESAPLPDKGVLANVNLASVNLDAWGALLSAPPAAVVAGGLPSAGPPADTVSGYLPTVVAVRARELTAQGRTLHNVVVGGSREGLTWRANVDATELNGYAEYRQASGASAGRVHARLARLAIAASAASEVETLLDQQPVNMPTLDIVVDDFELRGKKLGRLEIEAVNRGAATAARDGGVREWRLNKLNLTMPEAVFSATGNWTGVELPQQGAAATRPGPRPAGERRRTTMNFKLDIADAGQLLDRFGMKDVVRRGRGRMEGQAAWLGSPLTLDYPSMNGAFYVNVEAGQFLKADPGLAKLLGVLSLQSLPRRLALDFRDVFSEGFAFDFLRGDVTIQHGIAATNNLQMKGVNAAVLMEGRADIAKETQDIKVVVVPEINAGTASLVATVINPAIGLGTFLAQMFLREPLIRAATQEFHIDGTWADPRITKVNRRSLAPGGQADVAAENRPARGN